MSMFGDIDVNEISTGPKDGIYDGTVRSVEVNHVSNSGKNFILVQYDMMDPSFEFPVRQYFPWPEVMNPASWDDTTPIGKNGETEKVLNMKALTRWKRALVDGFGVPVDRVAALQPSMLEGLPVKVTVKMNGDFPGVQRVTPRDQTSGAAPVTAAPVASAAAVNPTQTAPATIAAPSAPAPVAQTASPQGNPFA